MEDGRNALYTDCNTMNMKQSFRNYENALLIIINICSKCKIGMCLRLRELRQVMKLGEGQGASWGSGRGREWGEEGGIRCQHQQHLSQAGELGPQRDCGQQGKSIVERAHAFF